MSDRTEESLVGLVQQQEAHTACTDRYRYRTFGEESKNIRLLKLHGRPDDNGHVQVGRNQGHCDCGAQPCDRNIKSDAPRFDLLEINVDNAPGYDAISYAWGSSELCETVLCNSMALSVTRSCWELLHRLQQRDPHSSALYWIDAICINQESTIERNQQVALMEDIYIKASCVVVWPGDLGSCRRSPGWSIWDVFRGMGGGANDQESIPEMLEFIKNPYFTRIWPIQEIALARRCRLLVDNYGEVDFERLFQIGQHGTMYAAGGASFSDLDLVRRTYAQTTRVHQEFRSKLRPYRDNPISEGQSHGRPPVTQLLLDVRHLEATQPLDKIFAVRGMIKLLGVTLDPPDYQRRVEDVFLDATVTAMDSDQNLKILAGLDGTSIDGLPSWSPDWSNHQAITEIATWEDHKAGGTGRSSFLIDRKARNLYVRGLQIDVIDERFVEFPETAVLETGSRLLELISSPLNSQPEVWQDNYVYFLESLSLDLLKGKLDSLRDKYDVMYRDVVKSHRKKSDSGPASFTRWLFRSTEIPNRGRLVHQHVLRANLCRRLDRKWFFRTRDERFGIASKHVQAGDLVVLLEKCNLPLVVRPKGDKWTLIGPAYIPQDGVMEGLLWDDNGGLQDFTFI